MDRLFDLTGKVAVAIGRNSVLGSAMAKGLAAYGAKVAIVGRNLDKAEQVAADIRHHGGTAQAFQADVSDRASLLQVAERIEQWAEGWDILLNTPLFLDFSRLSKTGKYWMMNGLKRLCAIRR
ncbi:hypothetical protein GS3922_11560 [Geobacillus subterraneus]|uniref:Gluconate 5-dehydrogenase n=1 Tax=Geobacillus subterraneus TaxID=129338 RepID=A0ABN4NHU6_9BACL|nr:hypothetical protein GS3922_11560 [Geobacillus subterraneus]KZS27161.1 hypothetical protein A5418_13055 [Geobacillus subterraneus]